MKPADIIRIICRYFDTTIEQVACESRVYPLPEIRRIIIYFLRRLTTLTLDEIGSYLHKDHSTVSFMMKTAIDYRDTSPDFRFKLNQIEKMITTHKETGILDENEKLLMKYDEIIMNEFYINSLI